MSSADKVNFVISVKLLNNVASKQVASASWRNTPACDFYIEKSLPSGSLHIKSHIAPSWGTSYFRSRFLMSSKVLIAGDKPPWTQKILSSMIAASAK